MQATKLDSRALDTFCERLRQAWHRSLQKRSQRAAWTSEQRARFDKTFALPKPRITVDTLPRCQPIHTKTRVITSRPKVAARPDAPLARLHRITHVPTITQREKRSESQPSAGAESM